jgi:adenylate kinase family enzyme
VRIAVVGTSGSGKTTLAKALATQFAIPHIELDAVNWQASWRDLSRTDGDEFVRRVALAIAAKNTGGRWQLRRRSRPRLAARDPFGLARL